MTDVIGSTSAGSSQPLTISTNRAAASATTQGSSNSASATSSQSATHTSTQQQRPAHTYRQPSPDSDAMLEETYSAGAYNQHRTLDSEGTDVLTSLAMLKHAAVKQQPLPRTPVQQQQDEEDSHALSQLPAAPGGPLQTSSLQVAVDDLTDGSELPGSESIDESATPTSHTTQSTNAQTSYQSHIVDQSDMSQLSSAANSPIQRQRHISHGAQVPQHQAPIATYPPVQPAAYHPHPATHYVDHSQQVQAPAPVYQVAQSGGEPAQQIVPQPTITTTVSQSSTNNTDFGSLAPPTVNQAALQYPHCYLSSLDPSSDFPFKTSEGKLLLYCVGKVNLQLKDQNCRRGGAKAATLRFDIHSVASESQQATKQETASNASHQLKAEQQQLLGSEATAAATTATASSETYQSPDGPVTSSSDANSTPQQQQAAESASVTEGVSQLTLPPATSTGLTPPQSPGATNMSDAGSQISGSGGSHAGLHAHTGGAAHGNSDADSVSGSQGTSSTVRVLIESKLYSKKGFFNKYARYVRGKYGVTLISADCAYFIVEENKVKDLVMMSTSEKTDARNPRHALQVDTNYSIYFFATSKQAWIEHTNTEKHADVEVVVAGSSGNVVLKHPAMHLHTHHQMPSYHHPQSHQMFNQRPSGASSSSYGQQQYSHGMPPMHMQHPSYSYPQSYSHSAQAPQYSAGYGNYGSAPSYPSTSTSNYDPYYQQGAPSSSAPAGAAPYHHSYHGATGRSPEQPMYGRGSSGSGQYTSQSYYAPQSGQPQQYSGYSQPQYSNSYAPQGYYPSQPQQQQQQPQQQYPAYQQSSATSSPTSYYPHMQGQMDPSQQVQGYSQQPQYDMSHQQHQQPEVVQQQQLPQSAPVTSSGAAPMQHNMSTLLAAVNSQATPSDAAAPSTSPSVVQQQQQQGAADAYAHEHQVVDEQQPMDAYHHAAPQQHQPAASNWVHPSSVQSPQAPLGRYSSIASTSSGGSNSQLLKRKMSVPGSGSSSFVSPGNSPTHTGRPAAHHHHAASESWQHAAVTPSAPASTVDNSWAQSKRRNTLPPGALLGLHADNSPTGAAPAQQQHAAASSDGYTTQQQLSYKPQQQYYAA